jgi:carbon monoxide dehydrogenase subunit G
MRTGLAQIDITASPDAVWELIGKFDGVDEWMPGVDSCKVLDNDRFVSSGNISVTERLLARNAVQRVISYSLIAGMQVEHHVATITVASQGNLTHVTWAVEVAPDELIDMLVPHYERALNALKLLMEL